MTSQALLCIPDARLRGLFSLLLTDGDAQVTACHDCDELQRIVGARFYDLCAITLDVAQDLTAVIKAIRQLSPETRILLIAGKEEVERIIPLFSLGVHDVLIQPINPKKAITAIQKLLQPAKPDGVAAVAADGQTGTQGGASYRPSHIIARSASMRALVAQLWKLRQEPLGIILTGEPGTEFELVAREYQAMCGDANGFLVLLGTHEITSEGLATACSLDRLKEGMPCTFLVPELDKLTSSQQAQLVDFLRLSKRRYDRNKPLRFVFTVTDVHENGRAVENPFLEELLFVVPNLVKVPPLRERRDDIEPLSRKLVLDLTAMHPEYRVRSINQITLEWLAGRLWRGNYAEFCTYLCKAVAECNHRELSMTYFTARDTASPFTGNVHGVQAPAAAVIPPVVVPAPVIRETAGQPATIPSPSSIPPASKTPLAAVGVAAGSIPPFLVASRTRMAF
ncbi:MAG TPA: hypothetical protein VL357_00610 [Rariglobus sp.]|jgi:DNA-binding NtrC family response regulator|nr:hypothetical protein [Rariglobus sp.]